MISLNNSLKEIILTNDSYRIEKTGVYNFSIPKEAKVKGYIYVDIKEIEKTSLVFNIAPFAVLDLVLIYCNNVGELNYEFNLNEKSELKLHTFDYSLKSLLSQKIVNLNGYESSSNIYEFASSKEGGLLEGDFTFNHNNNKTSCKGIFNYISMEDSKIKRNAIAVIKNRMSESVSTESIKGVLLSKSSMIESKPILIIDHDDVKASHGCAIGTIDQNEIYYLMSRGLSKEEAMIIIIKSLVNPIVKSIENEEFLDVVLPLINSSIGSV